MNNQVHVFGLEKSNFVRTVMLVCEEKNIPYTVGFDVDGEPVEFKGQQHLKWHPFGKIPVLLHNKLALPETASICRYLDTTFAGAKVQPQETEQAAYHDAFCAIATINIDKALLRDYIIEFVFPKGENGEIRFDVIKAAQPEVRNALAVIDNELTSGQGILNSDQFTIADALIAPMIHYISTLPEGFNLLPEFPQVTAYLENLMKRASCKKVLVTK